MQRNFLRNKMKKYFKNLRKDWALGFLGFLGFLAIPELLTQDFFGSLWLLWFIWFRYFFPDKIFKTN